MSSHGNVYKHHKTRIEKCNGTLLEPEAMYTKWAYWCPNRKVHGWTSKPCTCPKETK